MKDPDSLLVEKKNKRWEPYLIKEAYSERRHAELWEKQDDQGSDAIEREREREQCTLIQKGNRMSWRGWWRCRGIQPMSIMSLEKYRAQHQILDIKTIRVKINRNYIIFCKLTEGDWSFLNQRYMKNIIEKRIWIVGKEEMRNSCDEFSNLDHYQHRLKRPSDWCMNFNRHWLC